MATDLMETYHNMITIEDKYCRLQIIALSIFYQMLQQVYNTLHSLITDSPYASKVQISAPITVKALSQPFAQTTYDNDAQRSLTGLTNLCLRMVNVHLHHV